MSGQAREADGVIAEAMAMAAQQAARDPKNIEVATDELAVLGQASLIALRAGDPARSIRHGRAALAIAARLPAGTLTSRDVRSDIAEAKSYLGFALLATAQARSVEAARRRALLTEARDLLGEAKAFLAEVRAQKLGTFPEEEAREIEEALARCDAALARLG